MNINPEVLEVLKVLTPILALIATLLRVIPSIVVAARARRRTVNAADRTLRVAAIAITPPWDHLPTHANWHEEDQRRRYRKKERQSLWLGLIAFSALGLFYGGMFCADLSDWRGREGSGFFAGPATLLFIGLAVIEGRYLSRIRESKGLPLSLYESRGTLAIKGEAQHVCQYSLGVLYNIGCRIVDCKTFDPPKADGLAAEITGATGFWPPKWMGLGHFKIISFFGERIIVSIKDSGSGMCDVSIVSDNYDPGVDEGRRSNRRNVSRFVEAWAFFPDQILFEPAS